MKTTIKNRGAESTLTISGDFYQILDENFASFPQEATDNLQEKVGITELTAKYLLHTSLSKLSSMNKKGIEKELAKHKKQIDLIFSSICVQ